MKHITSFFIFFLTTLNLFALDPSIDFRNYTPDDIINDKDRIVESDAIVKHFTYIYDDTEIKISLRTKKDDKNALLMTFYSKESETLYKLYKEYLCEYLNDSVSFVTYDNHCKDGIDVYYRIYQLDKPVCTISTTIGYSYGFFLFGILSTELDKKLDYDEIEDLWPVIFKVGLLDENLITPDDIEEIPTDVLFYKNIQKYKNITLKFNDLKQIESENNEILLKKTVFIENPELTGIKISCSEKLKKNPEFLAQKITINDGNVYTIYELLQNPKCTFDECNRIRLSFLVSKDVLKEMKKDFSLQIY